MIWNYLKPRLTFWCHGPLLAWTGVARASGPAAARNEGVDGAYLDQQGHLGGDGGSTAGETPTT
jgi:hypothetical protein